MKKSQNLVLVTGGAGFIGSHIVDNLIASGYKVRILDNLDPQVHAGGRPPKHLNKKAQFIKGSVTNRKVLESAIDNADYIFHEAAAVGVGQSMYQIKHYTKVNTYGTAVLLDILANKPNKVKKIIVAASMSSYGEGSYICKKHGGVRPGLREETQLKKKQWEPGCPVCGGKLRPVGITEVEMQDCNSIYAINKKDQEDMLMVFGRAYGIPTVALRYFNVFGQRQSLSNPYTGVAAIFLSRLMSGNRPVIYEDGLQTRDFISVHDIARVNILALKSDKADGKVFNVGTCNPIPIKKVAEVLADLLGVKIKAEITGKFRAGDVRHCFADITKIKDKLGFSPSISFESGMEEIIKWSASQKAVDKFEKARKELVQRKLA